MTISLYMAFFSWFLFNAFNKLAGNRKVSLYWFMKYFPLNLRQHICCYLYFYDHHHSFSLFFCMCMCFLNPTLFFNKTTVHFSLTFYFNISYKNAFIYTALSINVNLAYTVDICVIYKLINIQEFSCRMKLNDILFSLALYHIQ